MTALDRYMDLINFRRGFLFDLPPLDPYCDYAEVRSAVEAMGSPENLSMDGELTRAETEDRTNDWIDAMVALDEIERELVA